MHIYFYQKIIITVVTYARIQRSNKQIVTKKAGIKPALKLSKMTKAMNVNVYADYLA
jgi:hypothetical protein